MRAASRGFALVLVLWTVALLTVIAGSFAFAMRSETSLTTHLVERAQAESLAEGGLRIGLARLLEPDEDARWRVDGTLYQTAIGNHPVQVALLSEAGKVDLNRASDALIQGIVAYAALEEDPEAAEQAADAILDWRDGNRTRRLNGAEDPDYDAAGRSHGSRDGPFLAVEELTQVLGVTPAMYERLAGIVTVHSGRPKVDPGTSPRAVLLALPGVSAASVDAFLQERDAAAEKGLTPTMQLVTTASGALAPPSQPLRPASGTFTVYAQARVGEALARRSVIVRARVSRNPRAVRDAARQVRLPYTVLAWTDQARPPERATGASPEPGEEGEAAR